MRLVFPMNERDGIRAVLICGPTASGKSAFALELAKELGGVAINADSMQVYAELRVITNRPAPEEEAQAPHRLYGFRPAREPYSAALWLADAKDVLAEAARRGWLPVIVGGTGLYFKALTEGLSDIPEIPAEIRERYRAAAQTEPAEALHAELGRRDPATAAQLRPATSSASSARWRCWRRRAGRWRSGRGMSSSRCCRSRKPIPSR